MLTLLILVVVASMACKSREDLAVEAVGGEHFVCTEATGSWPTLGQFEEHYDRVMKQGYATNWVALKMEGGLATLGVDYLYALLRWIKDNCY